MYIAYHGSLDNPKSVGTNNLIKDFAKIVTSPEEIVKNYNFLEKIKIDAEEITEEIQDEYCDIFKIIGEKPVDIDYIARQSKVKLQDLNFKLTMLELEGKIIKTSGNRYIRNNSR